MKRFIVFILAALSAFTFTACGRTSTTNPAQNPTPAETQQTSHVPQGTPYQGERWGKSNLTELAPAPDVDKIINSGDAIQTRYWVDMDWTQADADAYVEKAKSVGFTYYDNISPDIYDWYWEGALGKNQTRIEIIYYKNVYTLAICKY